MGRGTWTEGGGSPSSTTPPALLLARGGRCHPPTTPHTWTPRMIDSRKVDLIRTCNHHKYESPYGIGTFPSAKRHCFRRGGRGDRPHIRTKVSTHTLCSTPPPKEGSYLWLIYVCVTRTPHLDSRQDQTRYTHLIYDADPGIRI